MLTLRSSAANDGVALNVATAAMKAKNTARMGDPSVEKRLHDSMALGGLCVRAVKPKFYDGRGLTWEEMGNATRGLCPARIRFG